MQKDNSVKRWFGENLAEIISKKIEKIYPDFNSEKYVETIKKQTKDLNYTGRVLLHAETLKIYLPTNYKKSIKILTSILGEENKEETGMFKNFYWILPIGKYVENFGLEDFKTSIKAIEEITKRNTGEYAIRPFIKKYPKETLAVLETWSKSKNFHLRRLASEGLRPKLPWATKLEIFIKNPKPVFKILNNLMKDDIKFVQKSVANNIADYLKVNKKEGIKFLKKYLKSKNKNTQWIIKHATRKIKIN